MKFLKLLLIASLSGILLISGCGGADKNGALTIESKKTDSTTFSTVEFTVAYTNPTVVNVLGVEVHFTLYYPDGSIESFTNATNNSGTFVLSRNVDRDATSDTVFSITASTGDFFVGKSVVIPKQGASAPLTVTPTTLTFSPTAVNGDKQLCSITGGTAPYLVQNVNPSPNPDISASVAGGDLTVMKTSSTTGASATIVIVDSASPAATVSVKVDY